MKKLAILLFCILLLTGGCAPTAVQTPPPTAAPTPLPTIVPDDDEPIPMPDPDATIEEVVEFTGYSESVELPDLDLRFILCLPEWKMAEADEGILLIWKPYDSQSPMIHFYMTPYEGEPEVTIAGLMMQMQSIEGWEDAVWQQAVDGTNVGNGQGLTKSMEIESLRVKYIWFNTSTTVYQVFYVYMHKGQEALVEWTMRGILASMETISGDGIGGWQMRPML